MPIQAESDKTSENCFGMTRHELDREQTSGHAEEAVKSAKL
jgi:hypothetical protein